MSLDRRRVPRELLAQIAGRMAHLGAWVADLPSERCYWSDEVCDIHEVPHGTWPSLEQAFAFYPAHWRSQVASAIAACARDATPFDMEVQIQTGSGKLLWVRAIGEAVRDEHGAIVQLQGAFQDIGASKHAQSQISKLAYFDPLTGLPNRQLLVERLAAALGAAAGVCRALLIIDLDNFKTINDTRGHDKGDILLRQVTTRLCDSVRRDDMVARFGGDEFVILLGALGPHPAAAAARAQQIAQTILATFGDAFDIAGLSQYSSASIGVTMFGQGGAEAPNTPDTPEEVLRRADLAMYHAKTTGRNAVAMYDPDMQLRALHRAGLEADLRGALAGGQLELHYQPLADVSGAMIGVEALARWRHPKRGMVSPAEFIPVAEDSGLILALGDWVLQRACGLLAQWGRQVHSAHLTMSVNVSAHQFHRPDFVATIKNALAATGANPRRLKLEVTESLMITDLEGTISKMLALRQIGVGFSLDDFGTGYSSLAHLHRLPLDELKIDQSFIRDGVDGGHGALIAHTILALGKALNLSVLAEGVETAKQFAFVQWAGCHAYQGFLYSRPLSEQALADFIAHATIVPTGMNAE